MIDVLHPGLVTTIQDAGRTGFETYGVPRSGMLDPFLAGIANRLVGNQAAAPLMEFALVGPNLRFGRNSRIAVCGFGVRYEIASEGTVPLFQAMTVPAGAELRFLAMTGWFAYIAVAGGIKMPSVLGSVSAYIPGAIGKKLSKGDVLQIVESTGPVYALRNNYWDFHAEPLLNIVPAQHTSLFQVQEQQKLCENPYRISVQSNRMGIRLEGVSLNAPVIRRSVPALPGALQVPRSGLPIVLGPDGPTTGGYSQIARITRVSWTSLAAHPPGSSVRFQWTDVDSARQMWNYRQQLLNSDAAWERK